VVESQGQGGRSPRSDDNNGKLYDSTGSFMNQIFDFVLILFSFFFHKHLNIIIPSWISTQIKYYAMCPDPFSYLSCLL
jgi:hypothetical protein